MAQRRKRNYDDMKYLQNDLLVFSKRGYKRGLKHAECFGWEVIKVQQVTKSSTSLVGFEGTVTDDTLYLKPKYQHSHLTTIQAFVIREPRIIENFDEIRSLEKSYKFISKLKKFFSKAALFSFIAAMVVVGLLRQSGGSFANFISTTWVLTTIVWLLCRGAESRIAKKANNKIRWKEAP